MTDTPNIPPPVFQPTGVYSRFGSIEDITPEFFRKTYLLGLNFVDETGKPYPDDWYQQKINTALSNFEHYTQLSIVPQKIEGELHDYYYKDYVMFAFLQLYHKPIIVNQETPVVKAVYPTGQTITTFPREWCRVDNVHGQIQLVPTQGTLSQVILGQGGSYLPLIYQGLGYLPQLFHVNYTAGFERGKVPQFFIDGICKLAAIESLSILGESVYPPGLASQSYGIDGMSESRGIAQNPEYAPIFGGRISQYKRELFGDPRLGTRGLFNDIKAFYGGVNMVVSA